MVKKRRKSYKKKKSNKKKIYVAITIFSSVLIIFFILYFPLIKKFVFPSVENSKTIWEFRKELPDFSCFGIDVSTYQYDINWDTVLKYNDIDFVFIRATAGKDNFDKKFLRNKELLKNQNVICGVYHYYRPNESSKSQADFFIKNVKLEIGDLAPVLDIEKLSKEKNLSVLKNELLNWLKIIEEHYKITPIIYTYNNYYSLFLQNDKRFERFPIWIAWYNTTERPENIIKDWVFWQFSDKGKLTGLEHNVDLNVFNGTKKDLDGLRLKK